MTQPRARAAAGDRPGQRPAAAAALSLIQPDPLPESALVARVRAGDAAAYEMMFRAHYADLVAFASRYVGSVAEAEEAAQDVLGSVWVQRERWTIRSSVRGYLFGAVRKRALSRAAHGRNEADRLERFARSYADDALADNGVPWAQRLVENAEVTAMIRRAVGRLPARQREVVALRIGGQLSYAEVAEIMGTSVKNVEVQLRRAVRALRERIPTDPRAP